MQTIHLRIFILIVLLLATGCDRTPGDAEKKLDALKAQAMVLDSLLEVESTRIRQLDSTIFLELKKAARLDSVLNKEFKKIDSLADGLYRKVERNVNGK